MILCLENQAYLEERSDLTHGDWSKELLHAAIRDFQDVNAPEIQSRPEPTTWVSGTFSAHSSQEHYEMKLQFTMYESRLLMPSNANRSISDKQQLMQNKRRVCVIKLSSWLEKQDLESFWAEDLIDKLCTTNGQSLQSPQQAVDCEYKIQKLVRLLAYST